MDRLSARFSAGPAREDRDRVIDRIVDRFPERVADALSGNREALVKLLMISADLAWQVRADVPASVAEVARVAQGFADAVADCYSAQKPPSDAMCDAGFALAEEVEALALEVLHRRGDAADADHSTTLGPRPETGREVRHLARAHVAALRAAAQDPRMVSATDVAAAEYLYDAVVALGREHTAALSELAMGQARRVPPMAP